MPNIRRVDCPFYVTRSTADKKSATITCRNIENNLGFDVKNQVVFRAHAEKENYAQLFCEDMYDTCPYYKAIYRYESQKGEKRKHGKEEDKLTGKGGAGRKKGT